MAEFIALSGNANVGTPIELTTSIACPNGYVIHREGSGILTLRGVSRNRCAQFARYLVTYYGNIAVPTGGTAEEIGLVMTISGEEVSTTLSVVTPAAAEQFNNVSSGRYITVPIGCCYNLAIEPAAETNTSIDYRNLNVIVTRVA